MSEEANEEVKDLEPWELREISNSPKLNKAMMMLAHMRGESVEETTYKMLCAAQGDSEEKLSQAFLAEMQRNLSDNCVPRFSKVH